MEFLITSIFFVVLLFLFLIPTIIAVKRNAKNKVIIILLNTLLGFTVLGWIVSLIWSIVGSKSTSTIIGYDDLGKLNKYREDGILSEKEYLVAKNKILSQ